MKLRKGFTLIELLIVITIIGILAVALLPSILGAPSKARDTQRIADLQRIQKVLVASNLEGNAYEGIPGHGICLSESSPWDTYLPELGGTMPTDPLSGNVVATNGGYSCDTMYLYINAPETPSEYAFGLYARMENAENGNTSCTSIAADATGIDGAPIEGDSCYAILVDN